MQVFETEGDSKWNMSNGAAENGVDRQVNSSADSFYLIICCTNLRPPIKTSREEASVATVVGNVAAALTFRLISGLCPYLLLSQISEQLKKLRSPN